MKTLLQIVFFVFMFSNTLGQNCPAYSTVVTSPNTACAGQPYLFQVDNTGCNGLISFVVRGNYGSQFASEITWSVTSVLSGATIVSGGPGINGNIFNYFVNNLNPAIHGNIFTLTINDSYGDGFNGVNGQIYVTQGATTIGGPIIGNFGSTASFTFGTNITISPATVSITTPSGVVTSVITNCGDVNIPLTLQNPNFCNPTLVNLPWTITCNTTSAILASGNYPVTINPSTPTSASNLVQVNYNPAGCNWTVTPQNDCVAANIGSVFTISPDPTTLNTQCSSGNQVFSVAYNGVGASNCCSTAGPLVNITSTNSGTAVVGSSTFGGVNSAAVITIPPNGTGGNATSLALNVNMAGFCFDQPDLNFPVSTSYWVTIYHNGSIVYDQQSANPGPSNFNLNLTLANIPGYNQNSTITIYIYPNTFSAGGVNTTYNPSLTCPISTDGNWTASSITSTFNATFQGQTASAAVCTFNTVPVFHPCCPPTLVTDVTQTICSGSPFPSFNTWQNSISAANSNCIVYSSVTPVAGSVLPNNLLPNGINLTLAPITQSVSAYAYCDANNSGTINVGDTYTLISTYSLTVNPNLVPTFDPVTPICIGTPLTALPTTSLNGFTGSWSPTLNNTATTTYTFTPTIGLCATTANLTITVIPQNTVAAGTNQTVCINTLLTNIALGTTIATGATFSGLPAGVTGSWLGNVATISGIPTVSGTFNYTVTTTGGCPPASTTGTITVTPQNTISAGTNQTICINTPITDIVLATTTATGATFSGLPAGVTGSWAGDVVTISGTPTVSGTFNYTVTTTGGCPPALTTGTITVTPQNTIAAGTNQTVCINTPLTNIALATTIATGATFTGLPAGVTGSWAGNLVTISGTPTVSGIFNYTVTTTGGCPPATTTGTITVTPQNTISAGTNQTICINTPITDIVLATTTGTGATFSGLPAGVTGTWVGDVATISGTPTVSGTFNYTVTTTGGCPPAITTGTITVTPQNTIAAGTNQTVCINTPLTNINLATTIATGATFSGLPAGVTGSWIGNVATISGTPTVSGTFNYTVTTTGGCPPATTTGTITVTPQNTIAAGTNQTVCINTPLTNIPLGTTIATGATFSGLPAGVTGSWLGNVATISGIPTVSGTFNYTVTTTGGCPPATTTGTITVTPQNTIAAGTNQTVCINTPLTNIPLGTTIATGATFSGLPAGVTGSWLGNVATISGIPTVSGTFNYTVTTTGGCPPASTTGTITVTPQNTIAAGTNQTVCINTPITNIALATTIATGATFSGLPAGVTGSWLGNVATISGIPTVSGTFNYTVTTTGGCPPASTTGTITVTPQNTISAGTNQTICINTSITNIALSTTTATGATFSGLPAGVTGSWIGDVATISGTPTISGTFNYTVTTTGGCPPAIATGTITVTPQNTIAAGTNQTVCINTPLTNIALATTIATGATFSGLPAGVTGSWLGDVATISGTPTVSGTFNYTVTTTGGCPPATTTGTITVTPQNTIAAGTNQTVCINTPLTNINLATTIATGATFSGLPAGVTGSWLGDVATISGTPTVSGTFNYTVITTGGCPPATTTGTITVTQQNTIAAGTNQTVCINTTITNITLSTTTATGATFSGLPAGVTGSWLGNVVTISGTPTASGTFNYTVTTTGGCPPATTTGTITVTPQNTIAAGTNQTVCINTPITNIALATTIATGATFSGLPAGVTGSWAGDVVTISGTPTVSGTFNYTVTTTGGCPPALTTGTITVTPQNTIAAGTNQTFCINTPLTNIALATTIATGTTFTGLPAGVTGSWAGNLVTISGTPTVSGIFNYTVTTTGGCPPAITTGTITVTPQNTIAAGTNQTVCINTPLTNIALATTTATGATFSGLPAGVTGSWVGNVVTISGTPTASGTFNYTVTTTGGCPPATTTGTITVTPQNTIAAGTNQTVCINTPITNIALATTIATGATFSGLPAGVTGSWLGNVATISGTPTVSGTFNYTVTTTGGCPPATTTGTITVTQQNTIAAGTNQTVCINTPITNIALSTTTATGATFSGLPAGVTGTWVGDVATISGTPTVSGTFNYTVTTTGGCPPALTTGTITVTPQNTIAAGTNQTVCINTPITNITLATTTATAATFSGLPTGVTGSWIGDVATISGTPTVSGTFNYTVTTTGGCPPAITTGTITVTQQNTIAPGTNQTVCINTTITNITLSTTTATGATFSGLPAGVTGSWLGDVATISGTPTVSGTFNYTVTTTGGCPPATTTGTITVTPQNTIAAGTNQTVCINTPLTNIALATTIATSATFSGLPAGVTGSWLGNVATISGTPTVYGTFNYTVTTTGGCPPAITTGTITVTPQNTIAAGTNQTVCINTPLTNIALATTIATGATFSGLPAGVTGSWLGDVATISGTPTVSGTFNYTVTTTGGCPPATTTGTITVTPQNTIAAGTNQTVCINTPITNIALATTIATGATFSGLPAGVTGSWLGNMATISGTPTVSGTFNYTVATTGGCPPASTTGTITVTPQNTIAAGTNQTVCINTPITNIALATTIATGATFSGLPAGVTGSWVGNVATISGTPTVSGTFNYTVITTGGCPPATTTGTITVTPQNTIAAGTNQTVCINTTITNITLSTTTATGATFSGLPAGVTGSWIGDVATISGTPTVSGTFNYTVTTTGGCPPAISTGTITVTPQNTIAAGTNQTVCINTPIANISLSTAIATGATFSGLPAGVTGSWAGNVVTISGTPTVSGTFNYTVTTTGGCPPTTTTGTITVTPQNTISTGINESTCINTLLPVITLNSTGATGATFSGLPSGVTGSWLGNVATISGTPTVSGTFNYTVATTGGCPPSSTTGIITVVFQNTISAGTNQTVCINNAMIDIGLSTNGATGATFSGLPAGVNGSWVGNVATISGIPTVAGTFNYTVTSTGGCPPAATSGILNVTPQNTITAGSNQTVCINTPISNILLTTTTSTGASFSGLPAGVTGSWAGNTVTISGTPTVSGTFNYTVTTTGGCPPAMTTGTIIVTPQNTITPGTNQTVCINTPIVEITLTTTTATGVTFSGLPAGVTGSWVGNIATISGTPTVSGTFNYIVTSTGGCPPATTTATITVNPQNTIGIGSNQTVCINTPITNISIATTIATGATFSGLPAGVTGSWAGNMVTISGTPTVSGTYNYTVTTTGGCPLETTTGTITVTPQNTIEAGTNQTICINSPITSISLATTTATGATFSGLPAGVAGSWLGNTATIFGTPTVSGTFNYTVTTTGGCPPATATGTITVTPQNTIEPGTNQTVCINTAISNIALVTTTATGATFTGLPAGVTGSWAGNIATISGTPTVSGTFNYIITTTGGCPPAISTGTITVTPQNTIAVGTNQTVCINSPITNITLATTTATGATFSGLPAGVTGSWAGNVATISGAPNVSGTFNYTVTTTGGCPPATTSGAITVTPQNTISAGTNQTVCINTPITNITLSTTTATGATFSGLPTGVSGSWAGDVVTISGTPTVSGTFNYTVTTTGGCPPATTTGTIIVNPENTIAAGTNQTVCINTPIANITLATTIATGTTFTGLPAGVTGSWLGNVATISGTPTVSGTFNYTVTTTGGCQSAFSTGSIIVNDQNTITEGTNQTICLNSSIDDIALTTTFATGATFSGLPNGLVGSWGGDFATISGTPSETGTFNYSVVTTGGCPPANTSGIIIVNPILTSITNTTICPNQVPYLWNGLTFLASGSQTATLTSSFGCDSLATLNLIVVDASAIDIEVNINAGCAPLVVSFTDNTFPVPTSVLWDFGNGSVSNALGNQNMTYVDTGCFDLTYNASFGGCPVVITYQDLVCVSPTPIASFEVENPTATDENPTFVMSNQSENATQYTWDFGDETSSNEENPTHNYTDLEEGYLIYLIAQNSVGCSDTTFESVVIQESLLYYVPNAFTPDGDKHNETFKPIFTSGFNPYEYTFLVFNRWGEIIFESHNAEVGWNGKYGETPAQQGIYTWTIQFKEKYSDKRRELKGHVNLIR